VIDCHFTAIVWQNGRLENRTGQGPLSPVRRCPSERRLRSPPGDHRSSISNLENTTPVAVKIKLKRLGKIRAPYYRIVVADSRTKRDGRAIEEIGKYHPKEEPSLIEVDSERVQYWLGVGAQPTEPVLAILKVTGDWQKFKGEPGAEGTLKVAEARPDKQEVFQAAVKETLDEAEGRATTPKSKRKAEPRKAKSEAEESAPAEETSEAKSEA
jgi:small subunit ribosomal protein S16